MEKSKLTKKYRWLYYLFSFLSIASFIGPSAYFIIDAFIHSNLATEKVCIVSTVVAVLILTAIAIVNKIALRSRIWILFFGLYFVIPNLIPPIMAIGIGQILHELVFDPIKNYYKKRYIIHKEVDKRHD